MKVIRLPDATREDMLPNWHDYVGLRKSGVDPRAYERGDKNVFRKRPEEE